MILCACAGQPNNETPPDDAVSNLVQIAPDLTLTMPDPADLGRSVEVTQLVTAHYDRQNFTFEGHINATPERFLLVGLDLMGRKIITIDWTKDKITYEKASWVPPQLRPENILADMVLLYWPAASVRHALAASFGKLVTDSNSRTIMINNKKVWHADYQPAFKGDPWSGRLHYRNLAWNYEFDVQSVETNP